MSPIPSPLDVLFSTLAWLGVPALVLLPLMVALGILEWLRTGRAVQIAAGRAAVGIANYFASLWRNRRAKWVALILTQAGVMATVSGAFRLAFAMSVDDPSGRDIASGRSFTWSELWVNVVSYSGDVTLAVNAALIAFGWVLAVNVAVLSRSDPLLTIVTILRWPVVAVATVAGLGIGLIGLLVLSLATWMNSPGYNVEMVSLYAIWVVLLGGLSLALYWTTEFSRDLLRELKGGASAT